MKTMREIIYSLPDQIVELLENLKGLRIKRRGFRQVLVCGMGGSGISGEILASLYPEVRVMTNKDYEIPHYIDRRTLAILVSYSGNTEETLNNYRILKQRDIDKVIISSNGALLKKKKESKIRVPPGLPPRGALGYLFTPLPIILHRSGLIKADPTPVLLGVVRFLQRERARIERRARALAPSLVGRLPVIYANSRLFAPAANRWRGQLNENAKILAHINLIPEMNHNEIVGLSRNQRPVLIFLADPKAHPRNRLRIKILKDLIPKDIKTITVDPAGADNHQRLFWTVMLGDFVSCYVASKTGVDPIPVKRIDLLKKRLARH